jgi:hypothetical protein
VSAAVMVGGGAEVLKAVTASVMTSVVVMVTASVMTSVTSSSVLVGARSQGDPVVVTASLMAAVMTSVTSSSLLVSVSVSAPTGATSKSGPELAVPPPA